MCHQMSVYRGGKQRVRERRLGRKTDGQRDKRAGQGLVRDTTTIQTFAGIGQANQVGTLRLVETGHRKDGIRGGIQYLYGMTSLKVKRKR